VYPAEAKEAHRQGSVVFAALISKTGSVESLKVMSGPSDLAEAASAAVKQWTYKPYKLHGESTEVLTTITVNFQLQP
jgi:periplasmic protein TonB